MFYDISSTLKYFNYKKNDEVVPIIYFDRKKFLMTLVSVYVTENLKRCGETEYVVNMGVMFTVLSLSRLV